MNQIMKMLNEDFTYDKDDKDRVILRMRTSMNIFLMISIKLTNLLILIMLMVIKFVWLISIIMFSCVCCPFSKYKNVYSDCHCSKSLKHWFRFEFIALIRKLYNNVSRIVVSS